MFSYHSPRGTLYDSDIHNRIVPDRSPWQHGLVRLKRAELLIDDYIKEGFRYLLQQVQKIETCAFNSALDCLFRKNKTRARLAAAVPIARRDY